MTATLTQHRKRLAATPSSFDLDARPASAGRRRVPEVAAGVLVIVVFSLAALWWQTSSTKRTEVLALRNPIERGHTLTVNDLQAVGINSDTALAVLTKTEAGAVVGRTARTAMVKGTLVTRDGFTATSLIGSGRSGVGLACVGGGNNCPVAPLGGKITTWWWGATHPLTCDDATRVVHRSSPQWG